MSGTIGSPRHGARGAVRGSVPRSKGNITHDLLSLGFKLATFGSPVQFSNHQAVAAPISISYSISGSNNISCISSDHKVVT